MKIQIKEETLDADNTREQQSKKNLLDIFLFNLDELDVFSHIKSENRINELVVWISSKKSTNSTRNRSGEKREKISNSHS